jgi:hypothetical protein
METLKKITDKTIAFVEGATHNYETAKDCRIFW